MIMTYDFIPKARRDKLFMKELREALSRNSDSVICTDIHRLTFHADRQTVLVTPKSETSDFRWKVVPKEITYQALLKMLDGNWDDIHPCDITDG